MRPGIASCATDRGIRRKRNSNACCARAIGAICVVLALCGCSITESFTSLSGDDEIKTGSLAPAKTSLADRLEPEDWRRAKAALGVALDPQGNGSPVRWDNPETRASGSFAASGPFTVKSNLVCRPFQAIVTQKGASQTLTGLACRHGPSEWVIESAAAAVPGAAGTTIKAGRIF